jgi:predicted AAA+ superfamily ATPase
MISIDKLKQIIVESKEYISTLNITERRTEIEPEANYVFIGQRRAGKTYMMYNIIKERNTEDFMYINFEDERLIEFDVSDFSLLIEAYNQLFDNKPTVYFDEIQIIDGWEKFCRRLADSGYKMLITGSNGKMLSKEIASTLGGRFMVKEIYPLSFNEFLSFNNILLTDNFGYGQQKTQIVVQMESYLNYGGLPESLRYVDKRNYLSNVFQKVFFGDIIVRYKLKNEFALKLLIKKIAESVNNETSFNRIKNIINSANIKVGTGTLIEYFRCLEESFLIYSISNYTAKISDRETKKKFYFSDTGILNLFLFEQKSKLLENLVFLELRRNYSHDVFYYKRKNETDFFIPEKSLLIQVSISIKNHETREREIGSLLSSMKELTIDTAYIITYDEEEEILMESKKINAIPYWKWVLVIK